MCRSQFLGRSVTVNEQTIARDGGLLRRELLKQRPDRLASSAPRCVPLQNRTDGVSESEPSSAASFALVTFFSSALVYTGTMADFASDFASGSAADFLAFDSPTVAAAASLLVAPSFLAVKIRDLRSSDEERDAIDASKQQRIPTIF